VRDYLSIIGIIIFITAALNGCSVPQHKCEVCGQAFDTEEELEEHMNLVHREGPEEGSDEEPGPVCDYCGKKLGSFDEFVAHMEKEHPDEWRKIKEGQK
jgi:hypothetical protein